MGVQRVQKTIGKSFQNRDIYAYEFLVPNPKFNVLLTGTTHGTEAESGDSVVRLMDDIEDTNFYDNINVVAVPYWNVDGRANSTYANAQNYQIGYSILNAVTPEMRALWQYLKDTPYYPDFYIDNHNLDHWNRGGSYYLYNNVPRLALRENLVIGMNTSSLYRHKMGWNNWTEMVKHVADNSPGLIFEKFWEVDDYANVAYNIAYDVGYWDSWLAARFDCLSCLIEGVVPADQTLSNPEWEATKQAQFLGNKYMIDWVRTKHPELVTSKCVPPYVGEVLPVEQSVVYELLPHRIAVKNDSTGSTVNFWSTSTRWRWTQTQPIQWLTAPLAYAIHNTDEEDLNVFVKWWGFEWTQGQTADSYDTEVFHCTSADPWDDEDGNITGQWTQDNVNGYYVSSTRTNFSNYTIFPVQQFGGDALIHTLEPTANGNISRHQTLFPTLNLRANDDYPILRLIRKR